MRVRAIIKTKKYETFEIPVMFAEAFERDVEMHFIDEDIPYSAVKNFCKAHRISLTLAD